MQFKKLKLINIGFQKFKESNGIYWEHVLLLQVRVVMLLFGKEILLQLKIKCLVHSKIIKNKIKIH
jgi:hypothetical protein